MALIDCIIELKSELSDENDDKEIRKRSTDSLNEFPYPVKLISMNNTLQNMKENLIAIRPKIELMLSNKNKVSVY